MTHPMPPPTHYPIHSSFNFGSTSLRNNEFDPDKTQDELAIGTVNTCITILLATSQHCINCDNFNW